MTTMTCLILWMPVAGGVDPAARGRPALSPGEAVIPHAAATRATTTTGAATGRRRRIPLLVRPAEAEGSSGPVTGPAVGNRSRTEGASRPCPGRPGTAPP